MKESVVKLIVQLRRYIAVAFLAFLLDFATLIYLTEVWGLFYLYSASVAFIIGLTTNYSLSVLWVFDERRLESQNIEFSINAVIALTGLVLNLLIIWFLTEYVKIHYGYSKLVSTGIVFWWNFLMKRQILFTKYE